MTFRAVMLGMLLAVAVACGGYFNDLVARQALMTSDLIPLAVYGLLVVGLLAVNPLLSLLGRRQLTAREWSVVIALMLTACVIPGPGLMLNFSRAMVGPHVEARRDSGWQAKHLLDYAPSQMLAEVPQGQFERVVGGLVRGQRPGESTPWSAWRAALAFYLPILSLAFIGGMGLVLVVHRQWAHRERLRYPIAEFASSLIDGAGERRFAPIFRNRRFWIGFAVAFGVLAINGLQVYFPRSIRFPLELELGPLRKLWPGLGNVRHSWGIFEPRLYFAAVGFAYFLSGEVSFTLGVTTLAYGVFFATLTTAGVTYSGGFLSGGPKDFMLFGAYLAAGAMILYLGRRTYRDVLLRAVLTRRRGAGATEAWGLRVAVVAAAAIVVILQLSVGLHWLLGALCVALVGLMFLVLTRVSVETGLFFIQPSWDAGAILLAVFGAAALGPHAVVILGLLCIVLAIDPRICLMPLAANALRVCDRQGVGPARAARWMIATLLIALLAGVFATLWVQYRFGAGTYEWTFGVARLPFEAVGRHLMEFVRPDPNVPQALDLGRWQVSSTLLWWAGAGALCVAACYVLRLRLPWWPIHPVLFLVLGTYPIARLSASFLAGWAVRAAVCRFGGGKAYRNNKPLFVGLVAGHFAAGMLWAIVGWAYYACTGLAKPAINLNP